MGCYSKSANTNVGAMLINIITVDFVINTDISPNGDAVIETLV